VRTEVVVIGAGQAGLSAAYHLGRTGLTDFVVLDDAERPGGAWQHRWPTLTVGQAHDLNSLPGMPLSESDPTEPVSVAVARYFAAYEHEVGLRVERPVRVRAVRDATPDEAQGETDLLAVETDRGTWLTRGVVSATGTWQKPLWPTYPGQWSFAGQQMHSRDYRRAEDFTGQHVVVVGGGASAVELILEIARVTTTTWVTRRPPVWGNPYVDEESRRAVVERVEERTRAGLPPLSVVSVAGLPLTPEYRRALDAGLLERLPMFERVVPDGVVWAPEAVPPAPEHLAAGAIVWATGFRSSLDHLAPLRLRAAGGGIVMDGPEVVADPRVQLVGYGPSAGTAGATRAARAAVRNLRRHLAF
jgi:cation diffusion facilitator CzcD-associated flavoprotein CzcO